MDFQIFMDLNNVHYKKQSWLQCVCTILYFQYEKCVFGKDGEPPLAFHDFKGIETENHGVHKDDVISALKGHMKEGYMVRPQHTHFR